MKLAATLLLSIVLALPLAAAERKPNAAILTAAPQIALLVAGDVVGGFGTHFRTDATLFNHREVDQSVVINWLPRDQNGSGVSGVSVTLRAGAFFPMRDVVQQLGQTGLGTILITAVDGDGNPDPNGSLDAFARIYSENTSGLGTVSQAEQSVAITTSFSSAMRLNMIGLRQDADFRTNVGIVNFDRNNARTFDVVVSGSGSSASTSVTVQPASMSQVSIPSGVFSDLVVSVAPQTAGTSLWSAYASSVDNRSGDGWISLGTE